MNANPTASGGGVVIVIDDDEAVLTSMRFMLEVEGHRVVSFADPSQVLDVAGTLPGGCMVVDYLMPGMTGLDLVGNLRGRQVVLPVIMMTSVLTPGLREKAGRLGIRHVFEKPIRGNALLDSISQMLSAPAATCLSLGSRSEC